MSNMSKRGLILISALLIFVLLSFVALYFGYFLISPAGFDKKEEIFIVEKGSGLRTVAAELERRRLIKGKNLFMLWVFLKGSTGDIKAGEYSLNQSMPPVRIFHILTSGAVRTYPLTIPEGLTAEQIADILAKKNLVNKMEFISLVREKTLAASYRIDGPSVEGYLFPDTYLISKDMGARELIDLMVNRFWDVLNDLIRGQKTSMPVLEIVTLASIVEKETGLAEERPVIASVFLNRLKKRMRLESDPTVIYGLKGFDGNLKRKDLHVRSPYNTYVNFGLPPGPIANPGRDSLMAVISPAKTDYLYFVSRNDGSHHFSATLKEHNRAVVRYQKRRRSISGRKK
ncbi:MAG: endolytic transglycosylase MltG [Desulfobacterales bacterium]|nr:endolytic transglycosylase MltG [Desulfobacterales bacterium]